jgi:hypothetical protein
MLHHNTAAFKMIEPTLFEAMLEDLADAGITPLVKARQAQRDEAVEVDIDNGGKPSMVRSKSR